MALALIWNAFVRIPYPISPVKLFWMPACLLAVSAYCWIYRPQNHRVRDLTAYMGLWALFPAFGTLLTYLAVKAGFPLQDKLFVRFDAALRFPWVSMFNFVVSHPALHEGLRYVYEAVLWQPFIINAVLILGDQSERAAELLTAILIGLFLTIGLFMLVPVNGPYATYGANQYLAKIIAEVRSARPPPIHFAGIVAFPSFHTIMVTLYTWANRGLKTFWPFLALNSVILMTVPIWGDHYLADVLGGAVVAAIAIWAVSALQGRAAEVRVRSWRYDEARQGRIRVRADL